MTTRAECYQPYLDPSLPHQLNIEQHASNTELVIGRCNCNLVVATEFSDVEGALVRIKSGYEQHVQRLIAA